MKPRRYKEIVQGRFGIAEIVILERKNTEDAISDKTFDFSAGTVNELFNEGYNHAVDGIKSRTRKNVFISAS